MTGSFADRLDAGRQLAKDLEAYRASDAAVLGLARGGVVVGYSVAKELNLPLRALIVRKVGAPRNPELALGAVSETGIRWLDASLVKATGASEEYVQREIAVQVAEARRRQQEYASGLRLGLEIVQGRPAIVVDDGIATGATAMVALRSARGVGASEIVLATPVASNQAIKLLQPAADRLVVLHVPDPFLAVGFHYRHFDQVTDAEVIDLLRSASGASEKQR